MFFSQLDIGRGRTLAMSFLNEYSFCIVKAFDVKMVAFLCNNKNILETASGCDIVAKIIAEEFIDRLLLEEKNPTIDWLTDHCKELFCVLCVKKDKDITFDDRFRSQLVAETSKILRSDVKLLEKAYRSGAYSETINEVLLKIPLNDLQKNALCIDGITYHYPTLWRGDNIHPVL